ncbi:hypothetical protein ACINLE_17580 [Bacillus sp. z60-18]|uniref:hypothetical protein n=1 Tax=unclassified Bacillus (in: firmicutes) TaxID=185979 RepID=UPI00390CB6A3
MGVIDNIGFTPAQYRELKKTMTDDDIAENELFCSVETLRRWKRGHGLSREYNQDAKKFTFKEWEEKSHQGLKESEIAKQFGYRNYRHYLNHKKKIGIPSLKKRNRRD